MAPGKRYPVGGGYPPAVSTLYNPADTAAIVQRIRRLGPGSKPQWGKMSAAQMLAHCQAPLRVATGELKLKRNLIGILFGKMAKKRMAGPAPLKRSLPTAPEFLVRDEPDFTAEQRKLVELVQRFAQRGPEGLPKEPHPFFGPMTTQEWEILQWKHLDHHLRQFGA